MARLPFYSPFRWVITLDDVDVGRKWKKSTDEVLGGCFREFVESDNFLDGHS